MTRSMFRICTIVGLGLAASLLQAEDRKGLEGVWDVSVTVTNCQGTLLRTVHSVQMFQRDGSVIETSNLPSRGNSEGVWKHAGDRTYDASYWFFRYLLPDIPGTFASFAKVKDTITLDSDDDSFTSTGTVEDFKADGTTITSCFTHTATRLTDWEHRKDDSQ